MNLGLIHSTESFGAADGPGVRFVIFLHGCNMRCSYCHNPDTWASHNSSEKVFAQQLIEKALHFKEYWGSEGGITVSGGEPLLQIDFLIELFKLAKEKGIHTCIDTSGQPFTSDGPWFEKFVNLMDYCDLILLDLKQINNQKHIKLTGKSNKNIIEMFRYLDSINKPIWARYVLVPGLTDEKNDLEDAACFFKSLRNIKRVDILPYHTLGVAKWEQLGLDYKLKDVDPPNDKLLSSVKNYFV